MDVVLAPEKENCGFVEPTVKPLAAVNDRAVPLDITVDAGLGNTGNWVCGVWKPDAVVEADEDAPVDMSRDDKKRWGARGIKLRCQSSCSSGKFSGK